MKKRKICIFTATRAEYGLLYWVMKEIQSDPDLDLKILVSGMHMSAEFGLTYKEIEKDGFRIDKKVEILLSSDTPIGVSKAMGLGIISYAEALQEIKPDIVVVLGDRFEALSFSAAAMICRIPIAHLHGGEATHGTIDEAIRHSISKMAHLHFVSTESYRKRVIQLGENPASVFNVGGFGVDNIKKLKLLNKHDFEKSINFKLNKKNILITYHPVTLEYQTAEKQFKEILKALEKLQDTHFIFTKYNADTDGRVIIKLINDFVNAYPTKAASFISMGQLKYLSALKHVDAVIGNSSSGIIEVPSFKKVTINIGDRQNGREKAESVIDCLPDEKSITKAIYRCYSKTFYNLLKNVKNPYGTGGASRKCVGIIKNYDLKNILKKRFYDLP